METQKQYSLQDFRNIIFNGFQIELSESTLQLINELSNEVGSPTYVKTPVFQKKENPISFSSKEDLTKLYPTGRGSENTNKKRRGKNMENVNEEDWESIRSTFHCTKIEQKTGTSAQFDVIRSHLNKLTDKNMEDMYSRIVAIIEELKNSDTNNNVIDIIYGQIFENAFLNRFYSKIYVLLYSKLLQKYDTSLLNHKEKQTVELLNKIQLSIQSIEYVDSTVDYDKFCKNNKENEKRKSMCEFLVNLIKQEVIDLDVGLQLLKQLFEFLFQWIKMENKKNEVDEIGELISILWKRDLYDPLENEYQFLKKIQLLASFKTKDYLSLTNKTVFKFMDLGE